MYIRLCGSGVHVVLVLDSFDIYIYFIGGGGGG